MKGMINETGDTILMYEYVGGPYQRPMTVKRGWELYTALKELVDSGELTNAPRATFHMTPGLGNPALVAEIVPLMDGGNLLHIHDATLIETVPRFIEWLNDHVGAGTFDTPRKGV